MVNDPDVRIIRAYTDLNFTRRHKFIRSDITLDFGGQVITVAGLEKTDPQTPYLSAVLQFSGAMENQRSVQYG
jgi:hypothetical protein